MTRRLVILGTGGSAYDVLDVIAAINSAAGQTWSVAGFLDDARPAGSRHLGFEVLGKVADAARVGDCEFVNVIGSDKSFRRKAQIIGSTGIPSGRFATLVHPGASVSSRATLGRGVVVNFGVSIGGAVAVGDHVAVGPGVIIGHDSVVGDYSIIAPGAIVSGFVKVGRECYVGAGAVVRQSIAVGDASLIGMGAVVVRDVAAGTTVVGNPARLLDVRRPATGDHARASASERAQV